MVGNLYTHSAKLTRNIHELNPETNWTKMWVENHDGLIRFKEIYAAIASSLREFIDYPNIENSSLTLN